MTQIVGELHWLRIFWVQGVTKRGSAYTNDVRDPPCNGWQNAFVIKGEKHSTIFCHHTFKAYQVRTVAHEIEQAKDPRDLFDADEMIAKLKDRWDYHQGLGWQSDYDVAARVLLLLGAEVPEQVQRGGEVDMKRKGGKEAELFLLKPVKLNGKRGQFLKWFIDNGGAGSIRAVMIEFDMSRSNALSYLHAIHKDHGIGYELVGDNATLEFPEDNLWPFDVTRDLSEAETLVPEDDDAWLND